MRPSITTWIIQRVMLQHAWSSHERTREWKRTKEASSACQAKFSAVTPELCSDEIWKRQTIAAEEEGACLPVGIPLEKQSKTHFIPILGRQERSVICCMLHVKSCNWKLEGGDRTSWSQRRSSTEEESGKVSGRSGERNKLSRQISEEKETVGVKSGKILVGEN